MSIPFERLVPTDPLRDEMLKRMQERVPLDERPVLFIGFCLLATIVYLFLGWPCWVASGSPAVMSVGLTVRQLGMGCGVAAAILLWRFRSVAFGTRAMKAGMLGVTAMLLFRLAEYQQAAAHAAPNSGPYRVFVESSEGPGWRRGKPFLEPVAYVTWPGRARTDIVVPEDLRQSFKWGQTCATVRLTEPIHGFVFLRFERVENSPDGAYSDEIIDRNRARCLGWKVNSGPE